jgi:hypothetical protein
MSDQRQPVFAAILPSFDVHPIGFTVGKFLGMTLQRFGLLFYRYSFV